MTLTFDQQVALVTGGAGGIGAVVCRELAARGVAVAVADIALEKAAAVAGDLVAEGGRAVGVGLDVTASADVDALVERLTADYGRVDILVNCAGFPVDRPLVKMTDDEWRTVLDVCLFGTFATSRAVAPGMIERQYGRIVNLSSRAYLGNPGQANYSAAKAGVIGLTKSLSKELGRHGVTVNAIAPGMIAERAIADNSVKRLGVPEDVASAVLYLASPEAGFVSGDVLHVSGGRFG
jgi:3-oxoacyl-[acyl-carrier protein] reductase